MEAELTTEISPLHTTEYGKYRVHGTRLVDWTDIQMDYHLDRKAELVGRMGPFSVEIPGRLEAGSWHCIASFGVIGLQCIIDVTCWWAARARGGPPQPQRKSYG
jgi:hypothetical protein